MPLVLRFDQRSSEFRRKVQKYKDSLISELPPPLQRLSKLPRSAMHGLFRALSSIDNFIESNKIIQLYHYSLQKIKLSYVPFHIFWLEKSQIFSEFSKVQNVSKTIAFAQIEPKTLLNKHCEHFKNRCFSPGFFIFRSPDNHVTATNRSIL